MTSGRIWHFSFNTVEKKQYEGNLVQNHRLVYASSVSMINVIICLFVLLFVSVAVKFVGMGKEGERVGELVAVGLQLWITFGAYAANLDYSGTRAYRV